MTDNKLAALPKRMRTELEIRKEDLESILPEWMTYKRFVNMSLMAVARTPALANCDFSSIYLSLMECARLGLYPDGRQAAIVPYKGKATLLPMVQGIIELMLRAPKVAKVESRVVYAGDYFEYAYGLKSHLDHVPSPDGTDGREIIASYAIIFWEHTDPTFEVVNRDELDKARQSSAAPNSPAWVIWEGEQCRKVATKRASKYVDLTPEAQLLIEWDHAIYGDPAMEGSVEGPTKEYQSLHVKVETEQNLEDLKERMESKDNGEKEKETEEETEKPLPRPKNKWEDEIKNFIIGTGLVRGENQDKMEYRLNAILNASPFVDVPFGELELLPALAWVMAWEHIKKEHSRTKPANRRIKVLELWEYAETHDDFIDLAKLEIKSNEQKQLI